MIIVGCYTLANKASGAGQLLTDAKVYHSNTPQKNELINKNNSSGDKNIEVKNLKLQPIVQIAVKQGDQGDKVKEIQQKLNKFGYKLYVDGNFGRSTYNAVMDFQRKNKIAQDGIVGSLTLKKLDLTPTSDTMYKTPVITKSVPSASTSKDTLEGFINSKNFSSSTDYFIWIDITHQKVNIFSGANKKWHLVKSMSCSSGKASTPTVKGNFTVGSKGEYFIADSGARCRYFTQISGNYLFHSVLYDNSGKYIIDNTLGAPVSHGCIRLALTNAKFIYDNIPATTAIWSN